MRYKLISVKNSPVCKNSYYNGKYYSNDIGIIRSNCNCISYIKNFTSAIKVEFEIMYKWLHKAHVNNENDFNFFVMEHFHHIKNFLEENKKIIMGKNKKYYNIYFLIKSKKYDLKNKIIHKYGIPTVFVKIR